MPTTTVSNIGQSKAVQALIEAAKIKAEHFAEPGYNGPVCIARKNGDQAEVLTEHGSQKARVFSKPKAAKNWIKRNISSPAERRKLYLVVALQS